MGIQQRIAAAFADNARLDPVTNLDYVIAINAGTCAQEKHCETARQPASKLRSFRLWTYDVWGNARDGFDVNDRCGHGNVSIRCKRETFNAGGPFQFYTYNPTDRQLSRAAGFAGVTWDGSDGTYTAELTRNGRPIGELCEQEAR